MSIKESLEKVKPHFRQLYFLVLLVLIAVIFFGLGRLSALEERKTPLRILSPNSDQTGAVVNALSSDAEGALLQTTPTNSSGQVIGSKSGKKYYFPWCGTVKMIKPENQVKFNSIEEARAAGFVPGGNCKGLK